MKVKVAEQLHRIQLWSPLADCRKISVIDAHIPAEGSVAKKMISRYGELDIMAVCRR